MDMLMDIFEFGLFIRKQGEENSTRLIAIST